MQAPPRLHLRPSQIPLEVSENIKSSSLPTEARALEEDSVGLAVTSLNLLMFATAYGFNGAIDSCPHRATPLDSEFF